MKILKFNEGWKKSIMLDRVENYVKYAKIKYPNLTSDEIIEIIDNKGNELAFTSNKEKNLFKAKWDNK